MAGAVKIIKFTCATCGADIEVSKPFCWKSGHINCRACRGFHYVVATDDGLGFIFKLDPEIMRDGSEISKLEHIKSAVDYALSMNPDEKDLANLSRHLASFIEDAARESSFTDSAFVSEEEQKRFQEKGPISPGMAEAIINSLDDWLKTK